MPLKPANVSLHAAGGTPPSRAALVAQLDAADPAQRRQAARSLAGDPGAVAPLCARLAHEDDVSVWDAILTALAQIGSGTALTGLLGYLRAEPAQLRNEVLETLKTFPQDEILLRLEPLLSDPDPHTRIAAIQLIAALGNPQGVELLGGVLKREQHVNVAAAAVELLAEMGASGSVPVLEAARRRFAAHPFMSFAIDTALQGIRQGKTE